MKSILTFIILIFFTFNGKAQDEIDSCYYYSSQFKNIENKCDGSLIWKSFKWLTKNCVTIGTTTSEEVDQLFGEGTISKRRTVTFERWNKRNLDNIDNEEGWFDYYWEFTLSVFCDENNEVKLFPSDNGIIYFKDNVVVGFDRYSIG